MRHTCMQDAQGWTWAALEACAVQMVDRSSSLMLAASNAILKYARIMMS